MLVKELLHKIESKEMTVLQVAEHYQVSDRTIQNKIKKLGYQWNNAAAEYQYIGDEPEPINIEFDTMFRKKNTSKTVAKNEVTRGEKEVSSSSIASKKKVKQKQNNSQYDAIDELLNSKPKADKVYKGFYLDKDIARIIDSVDNRKKSELINQCLRKVFADKGLL